VETVIQFFLGCFV